MATFEDLKESCDKFVKTLDQIMDDENLEDGDCIDAIENESRSFRGYLDGIVNDAGTPDEVEDEYYKKGEEILKSMHNENLKNIRGE